MASESEVFSEWASQPFRPSQVDNNGGGVDVSLRVANALEYIAAQLGEIARKMDSIGSGFGATKEDFDAMNELLKKL